MTCDTCGGNKFIKNTDSLIITCPNCADPANETPEHDRVSPRFTRTLILDTAAELTHKTRDKEYGSAAENFKDVCDLWSTYLGYTVVEADVAEPRLSREATDSGRNGLLEENGNCRADEEDVAILEGEWERRLKQESGAPFVIRAPEISLEPAKLELEVHGR